MKKMKIKSKSSLCAWVDALIEAYEHGNIIIGNINMSFSFSLLSLYLR